METSRAGRPQALCRSVQGLQGGCMSSDPEAGTREGIGPGSFTHPDAARPKQRPADGYLAIHEQFVAQSRGSTLLRKRHLAAAGSQPLE